MNKLLKIIVFLLAGMSIASVGFAQQKDGKHTESVIVMTKARLDSLLSNIAKSKKALLKQRNQERLANAKLNSQTSTMSDSQKPKQDQIAPDPEKTHNPGQNDARILQELNRINQRIDLFAMRMQQGSPQNGYPERSGTTIIPYPADRSPNTIYQQRRPNRPQYSRNAEGRQYTDIKQLQDKIEALQMEITDLGKNTDSVNRKEISSLKERADSLNTQLEKANRNIQSQKQQAINSYGKNLPIAVLKNYRQAIYFANNSADLDDANNALLLQLVQMIKRINQPVTVLVQGYASKTGSSFYNYKLSLKRADAVKNVLTAHGIVADNIETLGHGVNKSHNAPAARRVEISLLIN